MEKRDFAALENMCQLRFREAGSCFHVCTQENLPVIFHGEQEMKNAMNIVAFTAFMFPEIKIFTFEVMVNHFHLVVAGQDFRVKVFAMALIKKLAFHPELKRSRDIILKMAPKLHPIDSLNNFRNASHSSTARWKLAVALASSSLWEVMVSPCSLQST